MTRILILGGTGYTGRLITELLLEQSKADVTIATRHPDKAQAFADELEQRFTGRSIEAVYADASNSESLQAAFRGQNMVVPLLLMNDMKKIGLQCETKILVRKE